MKKIVSTILIFLISTFLYANDRASKLDQLFVELKKNNLKLSSKIEQQIWKIWSTHPTDQKLTAMLNEGSILINDGKLFKAIKIFTEAIQIDPNWAEAWNKRATVYYLIGEYEKSQNDIDKVLKIEERHFGALAGQGLVNIQLENYEKAILSYKLVQQIYPSMQSPKIMIKQINELIKRESI